MIVLALCVLFFGFCLVVCCLSLWRCAINPSVSFDFSKMAHSLVCKKSSARALHVKQASNEQQPNQREELTKHPTGLSSPSQPTYQPCQEKEKEAAARRNQPPRLPRLDCNSPSVVSVRDIE
jgi:hypothetical protein